MLQRRGVIGLVFGIAALALGVGAFAGPSDAAGGLALIAGLLGVGAGAFALVGEFGATKDHEQLEVQRDAAERAQRALEQAQDNVTSERRQRVNLEQRLAQVTTQYESTEVALRQARQTAKAANAGVDGGRERQMILTDPVTSLFSESYFRVALDSRIASARRHLRPVAIGLLDIVEDVLSDSPVRADPVAITATIRQTLRDADTPCRLDDGSFAIILEDTPENGAVWTVERIRRALTAQFPGVTLWAGVACYPAHAFSTEELLDASRSALTAAREWKQDRIEVATAS